MAERCALNERVDADVRQEVRKGYDTVYISGQSHINFGESFNFCEH